MRFTKQKKKRFTTVNHTVGDQIDNKFQTNKKKNIHVFVAFEMIKNGFKNSLHQNKKKLASINNVRLFQMKMIPFILIQYRLRCDANE